MSPEKFHDAMNYLDDDLIAQTEELRQGRRTRPAAPKIIPWVAAAACLALVLGVGPRLMPAMENSSAEGGSILHDAENPMVNGGPMFSGADVHIEDSRSDYILRGESCGDIYMEIPESWSCVIVKEDGGGYFLEICPPDEEGIVRVGYWPGFGVCGTGLATEEAVIAGMDACIGTYDNGPMWSFITFEGDFVVINEGADGWQDVHKDLLMKCLETLVIGERE